LPPQVRKFLGEEAQQGNAPELLFHVPVSEELPFQQIAKNYETAVRAANPGVYATLTVSSNLWEIDKPQTINQGLDDEVQASFELRDRGEPYERKNKVPEGLVFGGETAAQQEVSLSHERDYGGWCGFSIDSITLPEMLVSSLKRHLDGDIPTADVALELYRAAAEDPSMMPRRTVTRMTKQPGADVPYLVENEEAPGGLETHYEPKHPVVIEGDGVMNLSAIPDRYHSRTVGVRRVVRLPRP